MLCFSVVLISCCFWPLVYRYDILLGDELAVVPEDLPKRLEDLFLKSAGQPNKQKKRKKKQSKKKGKKRRGALR
jgi:hypothetical protein